MTRSILVIDDEKDIQKLLQYNLEKEGYKVSTAKTGEEGFETARKLRPDLIILDLMLPGMDGLEVCRLLRSDPVTRQTPILMLTAKGSDTDQIVGLEMGASDYIVKPFSVKVLTARVRNVFRAQKSGAEEKKVFKVKGLVVDKERHSVHVDNKPVSFTKLELRILAHLMENAGKVFSRDQVLSGAWEGEAFVVDRTVDVHMKSIRQKLGKYRDFIETVRGTGYRFKETE